MVEHTCRIQKNAQDINNCSSIKNLVIDIVKSITS